MTLVIPDATLRSSGDIFHVNRIGILYHPKVEAASSLAAELKGFLESRGVHTWVCSAWAGGEACDQIEDTDLVVTIGGDGTILRAAQLVVSRHIPVTGVNMGNLGFMTELGVDEAKDGLAKLLDGGGFIDERGVLEAEIEGSGGGPPATFYALNDVVVARAELARAIRVKTAIDGEHLATYRADGVLVATATGSTGYCLAAGGPILHPQSLEFILLPILPHLNPAYPLVLPPSQVVHLILADYHNAVLTVDGHVNSPLKEGVAVTVKMSREKVRFLRAHSKVSFYGSLAKRLKGKR